MLLFNLRDILISIVFTNFFEVTKFNNNSDHLVSYWISIVLSVILIMDGFYKGYRTPKKSASSSLIPFSTSPNQLQEVTSSANATLFDQSKISPVRGRSVKEYDEQLTALKKENFNLKLRIYFLEERMGSTFRVEDKDNIIRKNIEYQVDIETLRKELDEKQDLLCQAVKALELEDSEHKRIISLKETALTELNSKIECLQQELKTAAQSNNELQEKNEKITTESSQLLQEAVGLQIDKANVRDEVEKLREQLQEMQLKLDEEKENNSILEHDNHELECLQIRCKNLESELKEKNERVEELVNELEKNGHMVSSCNLRIRTLEDALTAKNSDIKYKEKEAANRDRVIQQQAAEIDELRRLVDESHALCDKEQRQTENLKSAVMARDNTIADLEVKNEKNKSVIRSLEAKLDSIVHENKRQNDELHAIKQQRRLRSDLSDTMKSSPRKLNCSSSLSTSTTSSSSNVEPTDSQEFAGRDAQIENWMQELYMKDVKLSKLEEDYRKACVLISNLLEQKKTIERSSQEIRAALADKDKQIEELKRRRRINFISSSSHVSQSQHPEAENSVEESNENKNIDDDSKMDVTTLEWAKQLEDLMEIIQEKEEELENYKETLQEKDNRILELETEISDLKTELNTVNKKLEETQVESPEEKKEKSISWMRATKEKDLKIEQLECEVRKQTSNLQGIVNKELWDKNREIEKLQNRFTEKFKVKEQEIAELEKEVTSKNMQLTMLKDKISELGIQVNLPSSLVVANAATVPPNGAQNSEIIAMMKDQLKNSKEECKYLHKTIEELREKLRNTPERERDSKINQLRIDHEKLEREFEKSEKLRQETVNLCSILTTRLEELAHFLDSLLKHRSVLGMLGSKQRSAIKQAVDQSLDLSKSLSISIMNEDQCLAQLSSITGVLNTSDISAYNASLCELLPIDEHNASLTFNSHLNKHRGDGESTDKVKEQNDIIQILRAQIETMKKEIEIRDMELAKQNSNIPISTDENNKPLKNDLDLVNCIIDLQSKSCFNKKADVMSPEKIYHNLVANKSCPAIMKSHSVDPNCSESEAWSEPDRCVSQARIGLDCEALKNTSTNRSRSNRSEMSGRGASDESTEEELSGVSNLKTPSKRGSTGSIESRHIIGTLQEKLGLLENKVKEKENEILSLKTSILDLDNKSLELKLSMSAEVAKLRNEKMDIEKILKDTEEKFKNVDLNNDEMLMKLKDMEEERDFALASLQQYIHQVDLFESKIRELEIILNEKQQEYNTNIKQIETKWQSYVDKLKIEQTELRVKEINDLKNQYEKEWIHKTEWNKQISEMKSIYNEMEQIKNLLKSSESKIYIMEQAEQDLKRRLAESEDSNREKIIALKRELNESTLRASQAALERTKVSNEKLKLEAEIRKLEIRESAKSNELEEQQKEYNNLKNNFQKQITQSEQQKSLLQLKVSELEALNAELHNRLVKLQASDNVWSGNNSLTNPPKIVDLVSNYKNLGRYSLDTRRPRNDYASDEFVVDEANNCFNRSAPDTYHWLHQNVNHNANEAVDARVATNSSPDLGIESDQGRFSSLETNVTTTTRPLLQTLELTASMNNLLSANQVDNIGHYCNIIAHKELERDNCELKRTVAKLESNLEKTMSELSKINDKKVQVEKAVCKQIHKTSKVLRKARANLDSGSENEKRT